MPNRINPATGRGYRFIDRTGQTYGRLTVRREATQVERAHIHTRNVVWICDCECGTTDLPIPSSNLQSEDSRSCGCLRDEMLGAIGRITGSMNGFQTRHGHAGGIYKACSSTYSSWCAMKQRCLNSDNSNFPEYGGRGISICQRWLDSFENFLADMGERPRGTSIDRYPNKDGNYEPTNCRWAEPKQQANNRRLPRPRGWNKWAKKNEQAKVA